MEHYIAEAQAEISFKAGAEHECLEWLNADSSTQLEKAKQEGRQEVVDWFYSHGYSGGSIEYTDGIKARFDPDWEELQAKLKDWDINNEKVGKKKG